MVIDFSKIAPINTERLHIRSPRVSDRDTIFFMRTDATVNAYIDRKAPTSIEEIDLFISDRLQDRKKGISIYWVLTLKESPDQYIGAISLWQFSKDRKTAEVGYDLHPQYQGKGYMSEAIQAILEFGFRRLHLHSIEAFTHRDNIASRKLLERHEFVLTDKKDIDFPSNLVYERICSD